MNRPIGSGTFTALQLAGAALVLAASVAIVGLADRYGDEFYLIRHEIEGERAWWITAPQSPGRTQAVPIVSENPPRFRFARSLKLPSVPSRAVLQVRALRDLSLSVNDQAVALEGRDAHRWKEVATVDVASWLVPGENRITADVVNKRGPALLQILSTDVPELSTSGRGWRIHEQKLDLKLGAVVAIDVRRHPQAAELPAPWRELGERALPFLGVFVVGALPLLLGVRWPSWIGGANAPRTALCVVASFWIVLFVTKSSGFPNHLGFDGEQHAAYIDIIADERRLPVPTDGWEAFHPPLYYAATAAMRVASGTEKNSRADRFFMHLLPALSGLLAAWLAGRTALRLAPAFPVIAATATLAAGFLPMHVQLSNFASNEPVHTLWVSAALLLACEILCAPRTARWPLVAASVFLGLALVTKSTTSGPIALLIPLAIGAKLWLVEARPLSRATLATAAMWIGPVVLAGWFYARNYVLVGDPFVSNLNAFSEWTYWIPPGFHTPAWFLGFGEVLVQPYFSGFASYADGLYSAFWGDGYVSGRIGVQYPNRWWDYDAMAAVYPLALPATGILGLGFVRGAWEALRGPKLGRRLALTLLWLVAFGMFLMLLLITLHLPFNGMPKTFYALPALVPMAVAFSLGFQFLLDLDAGAPRRWFSAFVCGYGVTLIVAIALAFLQGGPS